MPTVRTTISLPEKDHAELTRVSNLVGISQADLMRAAIGKFLQDIAEAGAIHLPVVAEDRDHYGSADKAAD